MNLMLIEPGCLTSNTTASIIDSLRVAHIRNTLGLAPGSSLKVGILGANKGLATIGSINATQVDLIDIQTPLAPPQKLPLTVIVCLPRPKALRRLVADLTSMGAAHIILLNSFHVEKSYWQSPCLTQLNDYVQFGLEQAGDTIAPQITLAKRFKPFVEDTLPLIIAGKCALVAHPYASKPLPANINTPSVLIIGAENGFISYELDLLAAQGCDIVSLGARVLRTETAICQCIGRLYQ